MASNPSTSTANRQTTRVRQYVDDQLERTRKQVKTNDLIASVLAWAAGVATFFLLLALVDAWVMPLSVTFRWVAFATLTVGSLAWIILAIAPLFRRRINADYAAQMIERAEPGFKNSVLNYVFLRRQDDTMNVAVMDAVSRQAAKKLHALPNDSTVDRSPVIRIGFILVGLMLFAVTYKLLSPYDPLQTVRRILFPYDAIAKPASVQIADVTPGNANVFFGDSLQVTATVRGPHDSADVRMLVSTQDGQIVDRPIAMTADESGRGYAATLQLDDAGIQQSLRYRIVARDGETPEFTIAVRANPAIAIETIDLTAPAYTGLPVRTLTGRGDIEAVEGTEAMIHAVANLPIEVAYIELLNEVTSSSTENAGDTTRMKAAAPPIEMRLISETKATGRFNVVLNSRRTKPLATHYQIRFVSKTGERNEKPNVYPIRVTPDLAPEIRMVQPRSRETSLAANDVQTIKIEANDLDFAITSVTLNMDHQGSSLVRQALPLKSQNANQKVTARFSFEPAHYGLQPGDQVILHAVATDNRVSIRSLQPDPNLSPTDNFTITIIDADPQAEQRRERQEQQEREQQREDQPPQDSNANDGQDDSAESPANESEDGEDGDEGSANSQQSGQQPDPNGDEGDGDMGQDEPQADGDNDGSEGEQEDSSSTADDSDRSQQPNDSSEPNDSGDSPDQQNPGDGGDSQLQGDRAQQGADDSQGSPSADESAADSPQSSGSDGMGSSDGGNGEGNQSSDDNAGGGSPNDSDPADDGRASAADQSDPNGRDAQNPNEGGAQGNEQSGGTNNDGSTNGDDPGTRDRTLKDGKREQLSKDAHEGEQFEKLDELLKNQPPPNGDNTSSKQEGDPQDPQQGDAAKPQLTGENPKDQPAAGDTDQQDPPSKPSQTSPPQDSQESGNQAGDKSSNQPPSGESQPGAESGQPNDDGMKPGSEPGDGPGKPSEGSNGQDDSSGSSPSGSDPGQSPPAAGSETSESGQPQAGDQPSNNASGASQPATGQQQTSNGTPTNGNTGSGSGGDQTTDEQLEKERADLDHAKKATDLVLNKLREQQYEPDPELLEQMNWTKQDLRDFLDRWNRMKAAAQTGDANARQRYERAVKSLGLSPNSQTRTSKNRDADTTGLNQDGSVIQPPADLAPEFNEFLRDRNRGQ